MAEVSLEQVRSVAHDGRRAIDGLDLSVRDGEVLALLGPSGSGKTTLLRLVAGLDPLEGGVVRIDGQDMAGVPTRDRDVAMVVQDDALLPHLTVGGNVGFGLRIRKLRKGEVARRVTAEARVLRIGELLERRPSAVSGGERQAASVARATVRAPAVFLLDEPFARIDAAERVRLRRELVQVMRWRGTTALLVTNDPVEAMAVGDRIAVLRDGRIAQVGPPQEVYEAPVSVAVAQQVGDVPLSVLPGIVEVGRRTCWVRLGSQRTPLAPPDPGLRQRLVDAPVLVGVRPERVRRAGDDEPGGIEGTVSSSAHVGSHALVSLALDGVPGATLLARLPAPPRVGERVRVALDPARLLLFDPATGAALPAARG